MSQPLLSARSILPLALAGALLFSAAPLAAQTTSHPNLRVNPNQGVKAPPRVAPKPSTRAKATKTTTAGSGLRQTQGQPTRQPRCEQPQPTYRYDNYNGYHVPVYPGPDAPLPQGGYYNNGYYNNGYYSNGYYSNGYYNNGYYNNGYNSNYYNNGYNNSQTAPRPGSGFPPFERY